MEEIAKIVWDYIVGSGGLIRKVLVIKMEYQRPRQPDEVPDDKRCSVCTWIGGENEDGELVAVMEDTERVRPTFLLLDITNIK